MGRRPKPETREALITAGMELFAKHGLDKPRLDDICEHAGFTRGAFYVHFEDREPYSTSIIKGATNIGLCKGFVGHFQTLYDPEIYLLMHDALVKPIPM
jgi:AcrR family transcriptional regulator